MSMSHVSSANYPIAQPLATILKTAIPIEQNDANADANANADADADTTGTVHASSNAVNLARENFKFEIDRESQSDALQHFVRNCFVAMDNVFFSTPSSMRDRPSFQHRLLIRISTDEINNTLTITDLGSGMTRSDVINTLGAGSRLSSRAIHAARVIDGTHTHRSGSVANGKSSSSIVDADEEDRSDDDDDDDDSAYSGEESVVSSSSDESGNDAANDIAGIDINHHERADVDENENENVDGNGNGNGIRNGAHARSSEELKVLKVPAQAKDIGSFYAAMCALGEWVEIGTKSKFDDYYVFKLPADGATSGTKKASEIDTAMDAATATNSSGNVFSHFSISRPMKEGTAPTIENGFDAFTDIRGDSGTRVTIKLNQAAIDAGMLKEEEVLKPMLGKFLQASPYTVVLDKCCTDEQRQEIIDASRREQEDFKQLQTMAEENASVEDDDEDLEGVSMSQTPELGSHNTVKERAKFIPIRLSMGERKMLRLVEAAMACCDYTTEVDKPFKSSTRRTHAQLKHITSVLRGMVTACDYAAGQTLLEEDNYSDYEKFFRQMFEIARRHKIMNPEKMRTEYGKLIYLLQDAVSPSIQPHLSFSCKGRIETVYKFLEERGGIALLDDPLIEIATREVLADKKTREQISLEIRRKERAVTHLKQNYRNQNLSSDDVHLCLYSICDNDSFLNSNRVPIDKVINYLQQFFSPGNYEEGYSLSIVDGQDGSRLSHSHERQFYFALQSLTLWRDIIDDMFRLWAMAEEDLLSESVSYALQDTGQGHQRVQQSPLTYKSMQKILSRVQSKVNQWIGSNVIHLGDHNVPNALMFIDKYTQVPRILSPIVNCLENLERVCEEDEGVRTFVENEFDGVEQLKKDILYDFFKSAFDGSGADNFYDAGSCIDGRLTSAWNWCSQLQDKPFYCIFNLIGFTGFDGEFK